MSDLPEVDVPDWQLIEKLSALFRQYETGETLRQFSAEDRRGTYIERDLSEFRREVEAQEDVPHSVDLSMQGAEDGGTYRSFVVWMSPKDDRHGVNAARFRSGDEAIVAHLVSRTNELFEWAAKRRRARIEGETVSRDVAGAHAGQHDTEVSATVLQPDSVGPWWKKYAAQIVVGVVATVVGGLILAAVLGLFS